jgi:hypothetical protein
MCFFTGKAFGENLGLLSRIRDLRNIGWVNLEAYTGRPQQVLASRRG